MKLKKAVILLSGGMDSSTVAYMVKEAGYDIYPLTFNYGQRNKKEIRASRNISHSLGIELKTLDIDLRQIGGSALTDDEIPVPENRHALLTDSVPVNEIPVSYVPFRNTILLSIAIAYAEVLEAETVAIGANAIDYSGYPDCRPEYFEAMQKVVELGSKTGVMGKKISILTPILRMSKNNIVAKGMELGVPYEQTWSCYQDREQACGKCDACLLRIKAFHANNLMDPLNYDYYPPEYEV
ncbi:MAG: 7-cyano-7-deazaguanine synthase QueC [Candidatus Hodarchaeales archaeon]